MKRCSTAETGVDDMQHLDEGTIHAWLDGALSAEEGARVERHTGECAACAATVAEARGLVAGASRILSALDEAVAVAGGGRGAAGGESDGRAPRDVASLLARRPPPAARRPFWSRPAVFAAAATVVLMAGSVVVTRRSGEPTSVAAGDQTAAFGPSRSEQAPKADTVVGTATSPMAADGVGRSAGRGAPAKALRDVGPAPAAAQKEGRVAPQTPAPAIVAGEQARRRMAPPDSTRLLGEVVATGSADTGAASRPAVARRAAARRATAGGSASDRTIPTTAAEAQVATVTRPDTVYAVRSDTVHRKRRDTVTVSRVDTVFLPPPSLPTLRTADAARRGSSVADCYEAVAGGLPRFFTLEMTPIVSGAGEVRYAARAPGASGYWSQEGRGGIRLVLAGFAVAAQLDASKGELRGVARRGGSSEAFVARKVGCR